MGAAHEKSPEPAPAGDAGQFAHLRLHTEYSMRDGMLRLSPGPAGPAGGAGEARAKPDRAQLTLAPEAAARGIGALAITDEDNLFGAVKFYRSCVGAGVKPIVGCDLGIGPPVGDARGPAMLMLCKDAAGYANLCRMVTGAYERAAESSGGAPWADPAALGRGACEGLIALSGWSAGEIGRNLAAGDRARARAAAERWLDLMGDRFYLEVQRIGAPHEEALLQAHLALASDLGLPVACTHPVQFLDAEDFEAHEVLVCIHEKSYLEDESRPRRFRSSQYLKSRAEMRELFADLPQALENAGQIAQRCNFRFEFGKAKLPSLETLAGAGLAARAEAGLGAVLKGRQGADRDAYRRRLEFEIRVIEEMGFADYFLIVAEIVGWAKQNGIPVGPGRGSGSGSLVAYTLGITGLDPIEHGLLFERFLNPERVSMPDFDIDFCQENRERLISHVRERFGQDCVSQICTFGTLGAKAAVRSVGRPLGMPYLRCDQVAQKVPSALDMNLARARGESEELRKEIDGDPEVARLFEIAHQLEGLPRNVSTHAGGVLIAPDQMVNHCPLYAAESGGFASHFDKDDVETIGLVKFDFLGLTTLTTIAEAVRNAAALDPADRIDLEAIPLDDPEVYRLFARGDTAGVFQCESGGMRSLMMQLRPDRFEEVVALLALFRPGPLESGMADDYIERKHDPGKIDWIHDSLRPVLSDTYGVVVYQEQVMQMAQLLADYSLGEADLLRRAMGKKKPEEMALQKERFAGAAAKRIGGRRRAAKLFEKVEKFAGYGFNKSHAAAYALLAMQTAWLKRHHAAAFYAASLSSDMNDGANVRKLVRDAGRHNVEILPPDVNESAAHFVAVGKSAVRFGLCGVKGVGRAAAEGIIAEREAGGRYASLEDYLSRTRKAELLGRKGHEMLARAGAFDSLHPRRAQAFEIVHMRLDGSADMGPRGQESLFGAEGFDAHMPQVPEWTKEQRFAAEAEAVGFALSGHFFDAYGPWIGAHCAGATLTPIEKLAPDTGTLLVAGAVSGVATTRGMARKGLGAVTIEDLDGSVDVLFDQNDLTSDPDFLREGALMIVEGRCTQRGRSELGLRASRAWSRDGWIRARLRGVKVTLDVRDDSFRKRVEQLSRVLDQQAKDGLRAVGLRLLGAGFRCDIRLPGAKGIAPTMDSLELLDEIAGPGRVSPVY